MKNITKKLLVLLAGVVMLATPVIASAAFNTWYIDTLRSDTPTPYQIDDPATGDDHVMMWDDNAGYQSWYSPARFKSDFLDQFWSFIQVSDMTTAINTATSGLQTQINGLSSGGSFNVASFMVNQASTTPYVASSTFNGFMSSAMFSKLNSMSASTTIAYEGTTARANSFPVFKTATVGSGVAVFNITLDGLSTGTSTCPTGVIQDSVQVIFNDSTASYQQSWAFSNSNKTITVTANKFTTANILSGILGQAAANGSVAKLTVWCY